MPWVKKEMCTGCGTCVEECPVGAMSLEDNVAGINEEECIRCGRCHDVCPEEAVRHDSERIPQMVDANMEWAEGLMSKFDSEEEKTALLKRLAKYFKMQTKVAQQSLERLQTLA